MSEIVNVKPKEQHRDWADQVKDVGGLIAVFGGLVALAGIVITALLVGGNDAGTIAGAATTAVGSIVGAYLGVKIGTDQTKTAIDAQKEESVRANAFATFVPARNQDEAHAAAERAVASIRRA